MSDDIKYFGGLDLNRNTLSNVVLSTKTTQMSIGSKTGEIFFVQGDTSNVYIKDENSVIKIGSGLSLSEFSSPTTHIDMDGFTFNNIPDPQNPGDVVNLDYLNNVISGNIAPFNLKSAYVGFDPQVYSISSNIDHNDNMRIIDKAIFASIESPDLMSNVQPDFGGFSGVLPSGLSSSWYKIASPGDVISGLTLNDSVSFNFEYLSGVYGFSNTYGNLEVIMDGVSTGDIASLGSGDQILESLGNTLEANLNISIREYSSYWNAVNMDVDVNITSEGYSNIAFISDKTGGSGTIDIYYDDTSDNPYFSSSPTNSINNTVYKYLSSVAYLDMGSLIDLSFIAGQGIFEKVYNPDKVAEIKISHGCSNTHIMSPTSVPIYDDDYRVISKSIEVDVPDSSSGEENAFIKVELFKPGGRTHNEQTDIRHKINTFSQQSTQTSEYFLDEAYRLESNVHVDTAWNSQTSFDGSTTGLDAQVRNGFLKYPVAADYNYNIPSGPKQYHRRIYPGIPVSSGYIEFGGLDVSNISAYGNGSVNVIIHLTDNDIYFDLGKDVCFDCTGDTMVNAIPAREAVMDENTLNYTLETYSTGTESTGSFRLIIFFRDVVESISHIKHTNEYIE